MKNGIVLLDAEFRKPLILVCSSGHEEADCLTVPCCWCASPRLRQLYSISVVSWNAVGICLLEAVICMLFIHSICVYYLPSTSTAWKLSCNNRRTQLARIPYVHEVFPGWSFVWSRACQKLFSTWSPVKSSWACLGASCVHLLSP